MIIIIVDIPAAGSLIVAVVLSLFRLIPLLFVFPEIPLLSVFEGVSFSSVVVYSKSSKLPPLEELTPLYMAISSTSTYVSLFILYIFLVSYKNPLTFYRRFKSIVAYN